MQREQHFESHRAGQPVSDRGRIERFDLLLAALLAVAVLSTCLAVADGTTYGDQVHFLRFLREGQSTHHWAYLPLVRAMGWIVGRDPELQLRVASALGAGLTAGLALVLARLHGLGRWNSTLLGATIAATPVIAFFGTHVEVHAIQAACAMGAFIAATLAARRESRLVRVGLIALAAALLFVGHPIQVLMMPGVLALGIGLERIPRSAALVFAALCLLAIVLLNWVLPPLHLQDRFPKGLAEVNVGVWLIWGVGQMMRIPATFGAFAPSDFIDHVRVEWLLRQGLLPLIWIAALVFADRRRASLTLFVAACLPSVLILPLYGFRELGGFFAGFTAPEVIAAAWFLGRLECRHDPRLARSVLYLLLALQLAGSTSELRRYGRIDTDDVWQREYLAAAAALPGAPELPIYAVGFHNPREFLSRFRPPGPYVDLRVLMDLLPRRAMLHEAEGFAVKLRRLLRSGTRVMLDTRTLDARIPGNEKVAEAAAAASQGLLRVPIEGQRWLVRLALPLPAAGQATDLTPGTGREAGTIPPARDDL